MLDLAFVSNPNRITLIDCAEPLLKLDQHHQPFILKITLDPGHQIQTDDEFYFDFSQCDYELVNRLIENTNWDGLLSSENVNEATDKFYTILLDIIRENVPVKKCKQVRNPTQPWWNAELRNCRNRLRKTRKNYYRQRSEQNKLCLRELEKTYKEMNTNSFRDYTQKIESSLKNDPKSFWSYIRKRATQNDIPANLFLGNVTADNPLDAANLFSSFFRRVLSNNLPPLDATYLNGLPVYNVNLPPLLFTDDDVLAKF